MPISAAEQASQTTTVSAARREELAQLSREASKHDSIRQEEANAKARRPLYSDVEDLLNPGFLSAVVYLGDVSVCLRSLSPGDMLLMRYRVPRDASGTEWQCWVLATCTWMINGQVLLEDQHAAVRLYRTYRTLPVTVLDILWSVMQGLLSRVSECLPRVEAYCYEHYSRALWRFCGRQSPARDDFVGIPGVARLGMNIVQKIWVGFNLSEDERLQEMVLWNAAKLMASAASPKGVKKLNAADEQRLRQEMTRRRRVQDQMYFEGVGWRDAHAQLVFQPHTADELVEQMRRWRDGEKDLHDVIVDAWKERVRSEEQRRREERTKQAAEQQRQREEALRRMGGGSPVVGYTAGQVKELLGDRAAQFGRRIVHERPTHSAKFDRYIGQEIGIGYMGSGGARDFRSRDLQPSLDEQVQSRGEGPRFRSPDDLVPERMRERFHQDIDAAGGGQPMPTEGEGD